MNRQQENSFSFGSLLLIFLVILFMPTREANGAIAYVQNIGTFNQYFGFGPPSISFPVTANAATGNSIIITIAWGSFSSGGNVTCSDSKGNTYTNDIIKNNGSFYSIICSSHNVTALTTSDTITISFNGFIAYGVAVTAHEFSGLDTSATLDQTASATGNSTTLASGNTAITIQADELLVGAIAVESSPTNPFTPGTGFTSLPSTGFTGSFNGTIHSEFRVVSATGSYQADGTLGTSSNWAAGIATYKAAPSGTNITLSGTLYSDEGSSPLSGQTVRLVVEGASAGTAVTDASGNYSIITTVVAGDTYLPLLVYVDDGSVVGTTVTVLDSTTSTTINDLNIYADHLITRQDEGGTPLDTGDMDNAKVLYSDTDILYLISWPETTVTGTNTVLYILNGHIYAPQGNVTTPNIKINGTLNGGTNTFAISDNWTNDYVFNADTSMVDFTGSGTIHKGTGGHKWNGKAFYDVNFAASGQITHITYGQVVEVKNILTLETGEVTGGTVLFGGGQATPLVTAGATLSNSRFTYSLTSSPVNVVSADYPMLWLSSKTTGTAFTLLGDITCNRLDIFGNATNNQSILESASHTITCGTLRVGDFSNSNKYGKLLLNNSTVNISGDVSTETSDASGTNEIDAGSATINVGGDWTNNDTFTANTSTVTLNGSALQTITTGNGNFNNLTVTNASTAGVVFADAFSTNNFINTTPSSKMTFAGGQTYPISGTLNLNGGVTGDEVMLRSSTASQFTFDVASEQTVSYVDVQYSASLGSDITASKAVNSGNNDDMTVTPFWIFNPPLMVTNTSNTGVGSLDWAIGEAGSGETIVFDTSVFPPGSPATINQTTALPTIIQGDITIDASNAGVILSGGVGEGCIVINSSNNTVMGLRIQNCIKDGIHILAGTNNTIGGNNTSGSGPSGEGNVIVSNGNDGIEIRPASSSNKIYGNYIGTDGSASLGNYNGIYILGNSNIIGGTDTGQRNIISGNNSKGIEMNGADLNIVQNNYIGTNVSGLDPLGNSSYGVNMWFGADSNIIGGTSANARNIISANRAGVRVSNSSKDNTVLGNYIGTDVSGSEALGNIWFGVGLFSALPNTIGGTVSGSGNVISGNLREGVVVQNGISDVLGNYIGTNASNDAVPNGIAGIEASYNGTVNLGHVDETQSNVIGSNSGVGILLRTSSSTLNLAGTIEVNDNVQMSLGTLNMGDATVNLSGNWTKTGGTVNAETSEVILDGSALQTITTNDGHFNNLTVTNASTAGVVFADAFSTNNFTNITPNSKMMFAGGATYPITGTLNLNGGATGTEVVLRSSNTSQYTFDVTTAQTVSYVDVEYSASSTNNILASKSVNSGNNDDTMPSPFWIFNSLMVTNTNNTGVGSLFLAMNTVASGETILFDTSVFPSGSPATINQTTDLPTIILNNITIDGSNAGVILDGGGVADCIVINSNDNIIMGMRIQNCDNDGIRINGGTNSIIGGDNTNGSGPSGEGNVIVNNGSDGIEISTTPSSNKIYGNYIGTDGSLDLGNTRDGIYIRGDSNIIGGTGTGQRNIISGNDSDGIEMSGSNFNTVQNNYIGTNSNGMALLENNNHGIRVRLGSESNIIGGTTVATRNVISGNRLEGIRLMESAKSNVVSGNYIGTDANGLLGLGNRTGIQLSGSASLNTIGGIGGISTRNIISGNTRRGVDLWNANNNTVLGNYIGTDVSGAVALGNASHGVYILSGSSSNTIGGTVAGSSNIISGNTSSGIRVTSGNNTVLGNYIGTNSSSDAIPNGVDGITITGSSTLNLGNTSEAQSNVIGSNTGYGINLDSSTATAVLAGTIDVNDDVQVSAGTFNMNDATVNLSGNWTKSGGTINTGTSTVVLDGSVLQTITTNDSNFNNLTVTNASTAGVAFTDSFSTNNFTNTIADSKMIFTAGQTYTIDGSIVLQGASGQLQTLESSTGALPRWNLVINELATKTIDYVNVSWSDASGSHATHKPIFPTNSTDDGNNIDWFGATDLGVNKTSTLISDPINGTGAGRNRIPGAIIEYSITTTNLGDASPDDGTVIMTDIVDSNVEYVVGSLIFTPNNSGLTLGAITYSQRSTPTDYIYTPVGPFDPNVAGIKITTNGTFNHTVIIDPDPNFTITYRIRIQ